MELPSCQIIRKHGDWAKSYDVAILTYDERFLRRKVISTAHEERFW